ncbi:signal-regulatory protein beta-2-like isoform X2 [Salminus brasiliensis]|uniref:signal-regulatory protein beta-2-like isoform X2 n=1 Tax=Salminus brasiliensis TaxID=930266 RepID=UPI003B836BEB
MSPVWIIILSLQIIIFIYPAQAADLNGPSFVSVQSGQNVNLQCKGKPGQNVKIWVWYKQRPGQEPQEVAAMFTGKEPATLLRYQMNKEHLYLTVEQTTKDDEGMYFCGKVESGTIQFFNGTFLAVTGHPQLKISVIQAPVSTFVPLGENVTLQCTVRPENQAAELQVLWFRSAAGQSFPEIIYTHHNSSRQCKISSSKDGCVFSFSKNINNSEDTGTYYCAVSSCGKIIIGNGTHVNFKEPVNPIVIPLGVALGVCVVVIIVQSVVFYKRRNGEQSSGKSTNSHQRSVTENPPSQDHEAAGMNYASIQFKERKPKHGKRRREPPEDVVYSHVSHAAAAHRSNR